MPKFIINYEVSEEYKNKRFFEGERVKNNYSFETTTDKIKGLFSSQSEYDFFIGAISKSLSVSYGSDVSEIKLMERTDDSIILNLYIPQMFSLKYMDKDITLHQEPKYIINAESYLKISEYITEKNLQYFIKYFLEIYQRYLLIEREYQMKSEELDKKIKSERLRLNEEAKVREQKYIKAKKQKEIAKKISRHASVIGLIFCIVFAVAGQSIVFLIPTYKFLSLFLTQSINLALLVYLHIVVRDRDSYRCEFDGTEYVLLYILGFLIESLVSGFWIMATNLIS